jgi:GNAT superfamily N-acetyltransferase
MPFHRGRRCLAVQVHALRPATLSDLELLVRHRRAMWDAMGRLRPGDVDPSEAPYRRWLLTHLMAGDVVGWVAEAGGEVAGSGCLWLQETQPRPHLPTDRTPYLLSVFVEAAHRGHGIARALTAAAVAQAKAWGAGRLALHASDAGRPLYESMGFRATPEMWLDLGASPAGRAPAKT